MSLLGVSELSFEFPSSPVLFENVSFSVESGGSRGDRWAEWVREVNSASTDCRRSSADARPHHSSARASNHSGRSGDPTGTSTDAVRFVFEALPLLAQIRAELRELEQRLSDPASASEYAVRINEYQQSGGFLAEGSITRTLSGLGYSPQDLDRDVQSLSGGERTRAALARALSMDAELLVLDEPTNHLDIAAREWLEASLAARSTACVITSHDRALLAAFANRIVQIERSKVSVFENSYLEYRRARALIDRQAWLAYESFERRKEALNRAFGASCRCAGWCAWRQRSLCAKGSQGGPHRSPIEGAGQRRAARGKTVGGTGHGGTDL
jgi:energy-coupling factor transporter ATP-binding protein EcfA2